MSTPLQDDWALKTHGLTYAQWQGLCAAIIDAMVEHGPDGHCDGYTEIAATALRALRELGVLSLESSPQVQSP